MSERERAGERVSVGNGKRARAAGGKSENAWAEEGDNGGGVYSVMCTSAMRRTQSVRRWWG